MVKTRVLVAILLLLLVVSVVLCLVFFLPRKNGDKNTANVYVDGELVFSVDLTETTTFERTIETPGGYNVIQVDNGRIRVVDADCPDKVCVDTGWRTAGGAPIVCLPHKLVIKIEKNGEFDAISE